MDSETWRAGPGAMLRSAREARRYSKRKAANLAGISEGLWRQLENGERPITAGVSVPVTPRDDTLLAAALAVGVDPAALFTAAGRPPPPQPPEADVQIAALAGSLTPENRAKVEGYIQGLLAQQDEQQR